MNKKIILGVLLFVFIGFLTGCEAKKYTKNLVCTKEDSESIEVYGNMIINSKLPFSSDGSEYDKAKVEVVLEITNMDATEEKMKSINEKVRDRICGKDGLLPENCEATIDGKTITYKADGEFNDIWYNYTGEKNYKEIKEFMESHEGMTCKEENI